MWARQRTAAWWRIGTRTNVLAQRLDYVSQQRLDVEVYFNTETVTLRTGAWVQNEDYVVAGQVFLNFDRPAGGRQCDRDCYDSAFSCDATMESSYCLWSFDPCEFSGSSRLLYLSVYQRAAGVRHHRLPGTGRQGRRIW